MQICCGRIAKAHFKNFSCQQFKENQVIIFRYKYIPIVSPCKIVFQWYLHTLRTFTSHSFHVVGLLFSFRISVCLHMQLFMNLNFNSFTRSPMCHRIRYTTSRLQGSVQCRTCIPSALHVLSHLYARLLQGPQQQYYYT